MDPTLRILDVREKETSDVKPPSFPTPTSTATGFPQHKTRTRVSAFKQQRNAAAAAAAATATSTTRSQQPPEPSASSRSSPLAPTSRNDEEDQTTTERRAIDAENRAVLDSMSADEIAAAQRELFSGLDPKLMQMLLRRANLDEKQTASPSPFDMQQPPPEISITSAQEHEQQQEQQQLNTDEKKTDDTKPQHQNEKKSVTFDLPPPTATTTTTTTTTTEKTHFPHPPDPAADLDPADPNFLEALHAKYFPSLPADPSKLAWMAPLPTPDSPADRESPYYPGQSSLPVSQLRFDFRGALIPPSASRRVPVTAGLHHHGEAPEAAGYTVPELGRLARSSVPGQRCIAFRTLGRLLYRLGKGEWGIGQGGRAGEDEDDLAFALWRCVRENRVLDSIGEAAAAEDGAGHQSARAYAVEAMWLFEKGGWKERWRGL